MNVFFRSLCVSAALVSVGAVVAESKVMTIQSVDQFDTVLAEHNNTLIVVDFYATWCGPCKRFSGQYDTLSNTYTDVVFIKVDVDKLPALSNRYGIRAMPTFKFIKNNSVITSVTGAVRNKIEEAIKSNK